MAHGDGICGQPAVTVEQIHHGRGATAAIGDGAAGSLDVGERVSATMNCLHDGALTHHFAMTHDGHLHTFHSNSELSRKGILTEWVMSTCDVERQGPAERMDSLRAVVKDAQELLGSPNIKSANVRHRRVCKLSDRAA